MWRGCSCSCLSNYLSVYLSICLPIYLSIYVSIYLAVFLQVWKQSYSASLPQFSKLTTWKWSNSARHNKMCFAPQLPKGVRAWGALYCTCWLGNVLRATTACNFSSFISPDGSAHAVLASLIFDPPEPQTSGKAQWCSTFRPFRTPASSFFWLFLFSNLLSSSLLFSDSSHLWVFIRPYCRKFDF